MKEELTNTMFTDDSVLFGELEVTSLIKTLIRVHEFRHHNKKPKTIIFPEVFNVDGVSIEYPNEEHRRETNGES